MHLHRYSISCTVTCASSAVLIRVPGPSFRLRQQRAGRRRGGGAAGAEDVSERGLGRRLNVHR